MNNVLGMNATEINNVNVINLTPHPLNIRNAEGETVDIPRSGCVARLDENQTEREAVAGFAVSSASYGAPYVVNGDGDKLRFPEPVEKTIYIVSGMMLSRFTGREDVFAPGKALRDDQGKIIGSEGLSAPNPQNPKMNTEMNTEWMARAVAVRDSGGNPEALMKAVLDENWGVRAEATEAAGENPEALMKAVQDKDWRVRATAARVGWRLPEVLAIALKDTHNEVRAAAKAAAELTESSAVYTLEDLKELELAAWNNGVYDATVNGATWRQSTERGLELLNLLRNT